MPGLSRTSIMPFWTIGLGSPSTISLHHGGSAVVYSKAMKLPGSVALTWIRAARPSRPFAVPCGAIVMPCRSANSRARQRAARPADPRHPRSQARPPLRRADRKAPVIQSAEPEGSCASMCNAIAASAGLRRLLSSPNFARMASPGMRLKSVGYRACHTTIEPFGRAGLSQSGIPRPRPRWLTNGRLWPQTHDRIGYLAFWQSGFKRRDEIMTDEKLMRRRPGRLRSGIPSPARG